MTNLLLEIKDLDVSIGTKKILKDLNLKINNNEIHVIMGPNGSGKSTLSKILTGHPSYLINKGSISYKNNNLLEVSPEFRSHLGIFLAFQYPLEIPGVTNYDFLRLLYNEKQKYLNKSEIAPIEFLTLLNKYLKELNISQEFLNRDLNYGFSGGEKKKNEILQLLLLKPSLVILDELDSGLDVDAIKLICNNLLSKLEKNSSILLITHYPYILKYLKPDYIHIMKDGHIIKTGTADLIDYIIGNGYENIAQE